MSTWDACGNALSQQHFLLISPTGNPWDCAQPRSVCRGASAWCWERAGIAQGADLVLSRSLSQARQEGLEGGFSLWRKMGWRKAGGDHEGRASHCGEGKAVPQCHPVLCGTPGGIQCQPQGQSGMRGPWWHHSPQTTAWPCPVAWPGVHTGDSTVLPATLCSPRVLHPFPHPSGVHPSCLGLEMGHLWALCTLGSFKPQLLGGILCLSPFTGEPGTTSAELSTASPASALTAFLCLPKDTALLLLAAPWNSRGFWGATSWAATVPPERKQ